MPPSVASTLQRAQWTPHRRPSRGGPVLPCLWLPLPASPVPAGRAPRRKDGHSGGREEREITDLPYPVVDGAGKAGAHHPRSKQVVSSLQYRIYARVPLAAHMHLQDFRPPRAPCSPGSTVAAEKAARRTLSPAAPSTATATASRFLLPGLASDGALVGSMFAMARHYPFSREF